MNKLCIVGAGGHGAVVAEAASLAGRWRDLRFLDKRVPSSGSVIGIAVEAVDDEDASYAAGESDFVVAVGDNRARAALIERIELAGGRLVSVVHPSAVVSASAVVEVGSVVLANAVINARTVLGKGCIINTAATVDHDCRLDTAVHISPGAHLAGGVSIGARAWIGLGATIRQNLTVGEDAIVGSSAAVVDHVAAGTTVVGVPARASTA